jgi:hypothetical protein
MGMNMQQEFRLLTAGDATHVLGVSNNNFIL